MQTKHRVILMDILLKKETPKIIKNRLDELTNLVTTYGGMVVVKEIQRKYKPNYNTFLSTQKMEELLKEAIENDVNLIIINNQLKAQQIHNLNDFFSKHNIQVWDRIDLILKIFQKHAKTTEAKLEIELAAIKHFGPRIFNMGMELSQQGGGIGTRGIGETNIERMKRHLKEQERKIVIRLKKYQQVREQNRKSRLRKDFLTLALVGYTNAGKSSLLNSLTKKDIEIANKLFTTLDTRIGSLYLLDLKKEVLVSDTIGFISDLPPSLINSFKSTLEDSVQADIILHVIDYSDPLYKQKIDVVNNILEQLNITKKPIIMVFNKIDNKKKVATKTILKKYKKYHPVFVSAKEKVGLDSLKEVICGLVKK